MFKFISKIFQLLIACINFAAAFITIIATLRQDNFSWTVIVGGIIFLCSVIFLYVQMLKANNKLRALRVLAHRGKVCTIYFMIYLDFLRSKFNDVYDNEPKTNSLSIRECKFSFHYYNNQGMHTRADISYHHCFKLEKHKGKLDILLLHSDGKLVRKPKADSEDSFSGVYIKYQGKIYPLMPEPCLSDVSSRRNQVLDRIQCSLPRKTYKEEWLELHYQNLGGGDLSEDAVFVIYPENYGWKFSGGATIQVTYENPYNADIQLVKLPYDSVHGNGMKRVAQFEHCDNGKQYQCSIDSLDINSVYFVIIKHQPLLENVLQIKSVSRTNIIRLVRRDEFEQVREVIKDSFFLHKKSWPKPLYEMAYEGLLQGKWVGYGCFGDRGELLSYLDYKEKSTTEIEIGICLTQEQYKGRGLMKLMLRFLIARYPDRQITIGTHERNEGMICCIQNAGFKEECKILKDRVDGSATVYYRRTPLENGYKRETEQKKESLCGKRKFAVSQNAKPYKKE